MEFHVSLDGRGDLAARIYRQLLDAVLDGRLRPGERLPPTRELAQRLSVSRNTVSVAYERLTAEGFLDARVGAGTFVTAAAAARVGRSAPRGGVRPRGLWRGFEEPPRRVGPQPAYDFTVGVPDAGLFPLESWRRLVARQLRRSLLTAGNYADPSGHPGLRQALARYLGVSRSVRAGADDVVITQGAQQAFDLVGRVLLSPGDTVAVEDPGYPAARNLFRSLGARVAGVPVDAEGIVIDRIPRGTRLVVVTPSHQFPLGTPMSLARRAALLSWAEAAGAVIAEDDYDSEFRFTDRPLEPLQSLDTGGRVVYIGSFSKTLLPMLRTGFLVTPASLRPALRTAKRLTDWHGDIATQGALAAFLDEGLLARHIRKATRVYAERRRVLIDGLRQDLGHVLDVVSSAAGLHVCALGRDGSTVEGVAAEAGARGVRVETLAQYRLGEQGPRGLVLGYGAVAAERVPAGLRGLAQSFLRKPG